MCSDTVYKNYTFVENADLLVPGEGVRTHPSHPPGYGPDFASLGLIMSIMGPWSTLSFSCLLRLNFLTNFYSVAVLESLTRKID